MKNSLAVLALALLAAGNCLAQTSPTTSPERRALAASLFVEATELERSGKGAEAIKLYERAARGGNGKAATRLAQIYERGIPGVSPDYAEALKWHNAARILGEEAPGDAETKRRLQEAEARKREAEARQRAEDEKERQQPRLMNPVFRYPSPAQVAFEEAAQLEQSGKGPEAVKMYMRAARDGSGKAALRLAQIYEKGIPGVARDYALSLRWYNAAHIMGEDVPVKKNP